MLTSSQILLRYRMILGFFIVALVVSGVTAFPLLTELKIVCTMLGLGGAPSAEGYTGLSYWILTVRWGLEEVYQRYPWVAYGTDWLAFAHVVLAIFFIGPLYDPVKNVWVLWAGIIACVFVVPLALICGSLREIPFFWQLIDCSFGVFGLLPLLWCLYLTRRLEKLRV